MWMNMDGMDGAQNNQGTPELDGAAGETEVSLEARAAAVTQPRPRHHWHRRRRRATPPRRGQLAQLVVSLFLLVACVAASLAINGGNVYGMLSNLDAPFLSGFNLARHISTSLRISPGAATAASATAPATPTFAPTATATPDVVAAGTTYAKGSSFPSFTGPIADVQGCPGGDAPQPVSWAIHGARDYGAPVHNTVALTFDDGPTPFSSPPIISYLEKTHTPATFFVMGQYAKAYPYLIQREAGDGFTIGVHTWSHPDMRLLTPGQRAWQLAATIQQLHFDLGANYCVWLWRPPYGSSNESIVTQAGTFGLTTIIWNVDPQDWSRPGTKTIVQRVLAQVRPGSIILMHDGPAARQETAAALPYILAGLKARGLTPVSLPYLLFGGRPPSPNPTPSPTTTPTTSPIETPSPTATPDPSPSPTAATTISDRRMAWLA
jgi:peptidoglycan-N-acetylglucosamine deacetylase